MLLSAGFYRFANFMEPFALIWQVVAAVAIGGLVLVLIFAIVEPGPLVKRRPFPRKRRASMQSAEGQEAVGAQGSDVPVDAGESTGHKDGKQETANSPELSPPPT